MTETRLKEENKHFPNVVAIFETPAIRYPLILALQLAFLLSGDEYGKYLPAEPVRFNCTASE